MSCILATARGAVWAEHVAGIGAAADGTMQVLTRHGHSHPLTASYTGDRLPQVSAALLAAIEVAARSAARDARLTTVIALDPDLIVQLYEYQSASWAPTRVTKVFTVAQVAAGGQAHQGDDIAPPDEQSEEEI